MIAPSAVVRCALVLALGCGCGSSPRPIGEDLDTDEAPVEKKATRCAENCQSVEWVDREVMKALADIAVCMDLPAYAPQRLQGAISIAFREVPCPQAVARVAAAAGLRMEIATVEGQKAVVMRTGTLSNEKLRRLPRGDGWDTEGGEGGEGDGGESPDRRGCTAMCDARLRDCKARCGWNGPAPCTEGCEDRWEICVRACRDHGIVK